LVVTGRLDAFINTGGEKVDPEWVRQTILGTGLVRDVWVAGRPQADWGEQVVAWIVPATGKVTAIHLAEALRALLPTAARPKAWHVLAEIPRTAAGKIDPTRLP
jgi:acyl-CoA synthetase (AMP-forming)/AMP-acid ligase II